MKFFRSSPLVLAVLCTCLLFALSPKRAETAEPDQTVLPVDHAFVQALATGDTAKLTGFLDKDFSWCDSNGQTLGKTEVLRSVPKATLGDESGAEVTERAYGQVMAVTVSCGKVHILRLWVQRPTGWRLLVHHEVRQLDQPSTSSGSGVKDCENPCKFVPFEPANEAERAIIASWQQLETAVTAHDSAGWAPHIADEFVIVGSNSDQPTTKRDRMTILDKQKQLDVGSAPAPLVLAQMFDFGDAVVMTCLHQPHAGKPIHVSRLWIKRDGKWIMAISYQTTIQAGSSQSD